MASVNNIFPQLINPILRYRKTVPHILGGKRLDPFNIDKNFLIDWVLQTPENNFDYTTLRPSVFSYAHEVIELYSAPEVLTFKRLNSALLEAGFLVEFTEEQPDVQALNFNIDNIAAATSLQTMVEIAQSMPVPLRKVLRAKMIELDRPYKFIEELDKLP